MYLLLVFPPRPHLQLTFPSKCNIHLHNVSAGYYPLLWIQNNNDNNNNVSAPQNTWNCFPFYQNPLIITVRTLESKKYCSSSYQNTLFLSNSKSKLRILWRRNKDKKSSNPKSQFKIFRSFSSLQYTHCAVQRSGFLL